MSRRDRKPLAKKSERGDKRGAKRSTDKRSSDKRGSGKPSFGDRGPDKRPAAGFSPRRPAAEFSR